jgi:hypothetical protein
VGAKLKFVMVNAHREWFEVLFCHSDRSGGISGLLSLLPSKTRDVSTSLDMTRIGHVTET